jgi:serine/threonine protein kinase
MPTLRNCTGCGEHILVGDRFCAYCGAEQPDMAGAPADEGESVWDAIESKLRRVTGGKYEIRGLLGYGGMAAVFLADEPSLNRRVAIKVMSPGLMVDPRLVRRFLQEARTTAQFRHPNIVTIYEGQSTEDLHYSAMTYFPGRSL